MNEFFRCVLDSNPFAQIAATEAADAAVDAESVHQAPFARLVACAEEVQRTRSRQGQVVWGEAGAGKSHLLARLGRWAQRDDRAVCVILHHLSADAAAMPWRIAKSAIWQMTHDRRGRLRHTTLYRLVRRAVERALADRPRQAQPASVAEALDALHRLVDRPLPDGLGSEPETQRVCDVLFRYLVAADANQAIDGGNRLARLAVRWLSGDSLIAGETADLGVKGENATRAASAQSVLAVLADFASFGGRPMILCFDQVDGLSAEQFRAVTQFLHPFVERGRGLLVVLAGEQRRVSELVDQDPTARAAWDLFACDPRGIVLDRISNEQARQLLEARLRHFVVPFMTLEAIRRRVEQDPLFPLGWTWFDERAEGQCAFRPRDVIQWARDRWREIQTTLREVGGPVWLDGTCPSGPGAPGPGPAGAALAPPASLEPCDVATIGDAILPAVRPRPTRSDGNEGRRLSRVEWAVIAVNLLAIAAVLWMLAARSGDSGPVAERTESAARTGTADPIAPAGRAEAAGDPVGGAVPPPRRASVNASPRGIAAGSGHGGPVGASSPASALSPSASNAAASRVVPVAVAAPPAGNPPPSARAQAAAKEPAAVTFGKVGPVGAALQRPAEGSAPAVRAISTAATVTVAPTTGVVPAPAAAIPVAAAPAAPAVRIPPAGNLEAAAKSPSGTAVPTAAVAPAAAPGATADPGKSPARPIAVVADPETERLLVEAWGLIERGDHGPGRLRLLEARKGARDDVRIEFSLGLLDGVIVKDWDSAEKWFSDCARREPDDVPSLNNLAVAELHNRREAEAAKHWKTIVEHRTATPEVVQNLGCVRYLFEQGMLRRNTALAKTFDRLYTEAAVATSKSAQPHAGFRMMALQLADGHTVGWADPRKMAVAMWSPPPDAAAVPDAVPPRPAAPYRGAAPGNPRPVDPRVQPAGPLRPGQSVPIPRALYPPAAPRPGSSRRGT